MSIAPTMKVTGLKETLAGLRGLPQRMQSRVLRGAVAAAAEVIRVEAALRAPIYTGKVQEGHPPPGTLKKSIYQVRLTSECTQTLEKWIVSARKGKESGADAYYATWVEYGHLARGPSARSGEERAASMAGHGKLGDYFIIAQPFMRPAFEVTKFAAVEALRAFVEKKLPNIAKA